MISWIIIITMAKNLRIFLIIIWISDLVIKFDFLYSFMSLLVQLLILIYLRIDYIDSWINIFYYKVCFITVSFSYSLYYIVLLKIWSTIIPIANKYIQVFYKQHIQLDDYIIGYHCL